MTDEGQGYPPPGDPSAAGQPAPYPAPPGYGQPYPQYAPQPGYGQPVPQQPQYSVPPGFGPGPDDTAVIAPPAGYPPPGFGAPRGGGRKGLFAAIGAAVVVALAVGGFFLFSGGSSASATPTTAVKQLMVAAENQDVAGAKQLLCKSDVAHGLQNAFGGQARILSYTVGATATKNGVTTVTVRSTSTQNPQPVTEHIPVVKEGGSWKVCLGSEAAPTALAGAPSGPSDPDRPSATTRPIPSHRPTATDLPAEPGPTRAVHRATAPRRASASVRPSRPPSAPAPGPSICSGATNGLGAAEIYVGAAQTGLTTYAQSCVYANRVPLAVTKSLSGKKFAAQTSDANAGQFVFQASGGGSRITVAVAKQSDGHYYITGVRVG